MVDVIFKEGRGDTVRHLPLAEQVNEIEQNGLEIKSMKAIQFGNKYKIVKEIVDQYQSGFRTKDLSNMFFVCEKTICNYLNKWCSINTIQVEINGIKILLNGIKLRSYLKHLHKENRRNILLNSN